MSQYCARICVVALGVALGFVWALSVFILALTALWFNWGTQLVGTIGTLYIGYEPTFLGSLIGIIWAFIDGFIGGVIIAWLYNLVSGCCCRSKCKPE